MVQGTRIEETMKDQNRDNLLSPVEPTIGKLYSPVQRTQRRQNQQSTPVEPTLVSEASVQLSRDSIFGGFLRLHAPVEPTLVLRASVD